MWVMVNRDVLVTMPIGFSVKVVMDGTKWVNIHESHCKSESSGGVAWAGRTINGRRPGFVRGIQLHGSLPSPDFIPPSSIFHLPHV
jgi:hypothetical protein